MCYEKLVFQCKQKNLVLSTGLVKKGELTADVESASILSEYTFSCFCDSYPCCFLQRYHVLALFYCYHNQTAQAMEVWKKYALTLYQNILEEKKRFYYFLLKVFERITLQGL